MCLQTHHTHTKLYQRLRTKSSWVRRGQSRRNGAAQEERPVWDVKTGVSDGQMNDMKTQHIISTHLLCEIVKNLPQYPTTAANSEHSFWSYPGQRGVCERAIKSIPDWVQLPAGSHRSPAPVSLQVTNQASAWLYSHTGSKSVYNPGINK